jgi:tartrate dehydratase alpha subunit/fumarate hydratase class I-like protein
MEIDFYDKVVSELSEADSQRVEAYNLQLAGVARPTIVKTGRDIDLELASRYPEEYLEDYVANCLESIENKGLPFKRFKSVSTGENCISTATAYQADGTQVHESYLSMGGGCGIKTYTAQKPERPNDVELVSE